MYSINAPAPQQNGLVLLSGGLDSAVCLGLARENCGYVHTVSFDYGQKHIRELESSKKLADHYATTHRIAGAGALALIPGLKNSDAVGLGLNDELREAYNLLPKTWKPGRNLAFLSIAAAFAYTSNCSLIIIGAHQEDYPGYPDCRDGFLRATEFAIQEALQVPIAIWAPILYKTKAQIVRMGLDLKVPFEYTWSCYAGREKACGDCDACVRRRAAFIANDTVDPIEYESQVGL
jgi:7-cyano-7-deazaguanine synthase